MSRQYSVDDIAKYKAGSGYSDWIANLNDIIGGDGLMSWWNNYNHRLNEFSNAIGMGQNYRDRDQEGGVIAKEYYIGDVPLQEDSGLEHNLSKSYIFLRSNKQMKKSKKANAMHQEMFGTGMDEDEMSDMEGDGINEWMSNLSKLFKLLKMRATM
jgi:hypothetical protein